jgi:predicted CoA-binding protein
MNDARTDHSLGTPVEHRCETVTVTCDRAVVHVVLPPRRPCSTAVTDIQDAGYGMLAVNPRASEVACDTMDGYPGCRHLLLWRTR